MTTVQRVTFVARMNHAGVAGFACVFLAGCSPRIGAPEVAACAPQAPSVASWQEINSRSGRFSIRLPRGAREIPTQCIDSDCGRISAGAWTLSYDAGPMAGPGDSVHVDPSLADARRCTLAVDGRTIDVVMARDTTSDRRYWAPIEGTDSLAVGPWVTFAATRLSATEGGLYIRTYSRRREDQAAGIAALQTLRVHRRP